MKRAFFDMYARTRRLLLPPTAPAHVAKEAAERVLHALERQLAEAEITARVAAVYCDVCVCIL